MPCFMTYHLEKLFCIPLGLYDESHSIELMMLGVCKWNAVDFDFYIGSHATIGYIVRIGSGS